MKLFDSHCHLDDRIYNSDIQEVVKRMHDAGVVAAMIVGTTRRRSIKAVSLAEFDSFDQGLAAIREGLSKRSEEHTS